MKNTLIFLAACLALSSCRSYESIEARHQRIAQRKLRKALKHDPTIIQRQYLDTAIRGVATGVVDIAIPGVDIQTEFDCDSLVRVLRALSSNRDTNQSAIYIYNDSVASIAVKLGNNGKPNLAFNVKPRILRDTVEVPYQVNVRVPGKTFNVAIKAPVYTYWWFWILCVTNLLLLALWVRSLFNNQSISITNRTAKTTD